MKTCANCGHTMEDQDVFCGNCGAMSLDGTEQTQQQAAPAAEAETAPVQEAAPVPEAGSAPEPVLEATKPAGGGKGLWKIGVIAAAAVVVLVIAVLGITGALKGGSKSFADVQTEFLLDAGIQYVDQWVEQYEAMTNLSTDLTITAESSLPENEKYLDGTALEIGLETQRDAFALDADVKLMGSDILSGVVQLDDGMLSLSLPQVSDKCYVLDLKQMIYEATGVEITELALPEISGDTVTSLLKNYFTIVVSTATDDNVTVEKDCPIELPWLGQTVDGTFYTFRPTAQDVEGMLLRLADALENDEELREFVTSLTGGNLLALSSDDLNADWQQELDATIAELREQAADLGQMVADSGFTWTVGYADGRVVYQKLSTDDETCLAYESLGEEKTGRSDVLYMQEAGGSQPMAIEAEYTKNDGKYSGTLYMSQEDAVVLDMTFKDVDEEERSALGAAYGIYSFTMSDYSMDVTMDMSVQKSENGGTDHRIALSSQDAESGESTELLAINMHSTDEKATISQPEGERVEISSAEDSSLEELSMLLQQYFMSMLLPMSMDGITG